MDVNEKLELIKEHHKLKTLALFQKLEQEARQQLRKLIASNEINYYAYDCKKYELAKILLAVIMQKMADTTAIRAGAKENKKLFNKLLSFLYREEKNENK